MAESNGNGNANGNGSSTRRRGAMRPDRPASKAKPGELTGGQSRRGTGGGGGRSSLDPMIGAGSFDLNPPTFNGTGYYPDRSSGAVNGLTGSVIRNGQGANAVGALPFIYSAQSVLPGYREPCPGDYRFYREADAVPTIVLAKATICGPVLAGSWSYEGDEDTPDERIDFIREQLDPMRAPVVAEMLRALSFGWRPFEKVFELRVFKVLGSMLALRKLKPLLPDYTRIVVVKDTGAFDGLVQDFSTTKSTQVIIPPNKSFVFTHDGEAGDPYGRSRHENVRKILAHYNDATDMAGRLGTKVSSIIPIVKFPQGESQTNDADEIVANTAQNRAIAQALVENLTIARGIAFETESFDVADLRANPKLAELTKWAIDTVDIGSSATGLSSLVGEREYFDKLLFRGWLVPERAALEGSHGTLAEAEAHADIALTDSELVHKDIVRYLNWYVVDELLAMNFGEDARGTVWITPSPIVDTAKQNIRKLFDAMLANPASLEIVLSETDRGAIYEQLEIPADASGGTDPENADPSENADAVADVFAKARGDQFKQDAADNAGAADEEFAASAVRAAIQLAAEQADSIADLELNCGTGAGGFKPGNTCAAGGSDGGGALPEKPTAYFNTDAAYLRKKYGQNVRVQHVVMAQIKPVRARPEGIANAEPLMRRAAMGEGGKRDPITLIRQPDGTFTVFDGNSTFAIAQKHGWQKIPAIVVDSEETAQRIERIAKAVKATTHTRADDPGDEDARAAVEQLPHKPTAARQTSSDLDVLYAQANAAKPEYDVMMNRGQGVSKRLGATTYDVQSKDQFAQMLRDFEDGPAGPAVILAPIKGRARALEKIAGYKGDTARLADLVRGTVAVDTVADLPRAVAAIQAEAQARGFRVASSENRYNNPTDGGYRDYVLKVTTPSGHVTELQVNTKAMIVAKEGLGHKLYEEARTISDRAVAENRATTPAEATRLNTLNKQMSDLYHAAWQKSLKRRPAAAAAASKPTMQQRLRNLADAASDIGNDLLDFA